MTAKPPSKKTRGTPAVLPSWWLEELKKKIREKSDDAIAKRVSGASLRGTAWDRSTVAKFLKGKWPTLELVVAFSKSYGLPTPIFVARSLGEALHLQAEAKSYDDDGDEESGLEKVLRLARLDAITQDLEDEVSDQTSRVESSNVEGASRRGRPGSLARGRKAAS